MGNLAALGMRLIDLPEWIASELESLSADAGQLPTGIVAFRRTRSSFKLLIGSDPMCQSTRLSEIGGGTTIQTAPMASCPIRARTWLAESELVIPTGHGGFADPKAIAEVARILKSDLLGNNSARAADSECSVDVSFKPGN